MCNTVMHNMVVRNAVMHITVLRTTAQRIIALPYEEYRLTAVSRSAFCFCWLLFSYSLLRAIYIFSTGHSSTSSRGVYVSSAGSGSWTKPNEAVRLFSSIHSPAS